MSKVSKQERLAYRTAASIFLDLSETVTSDLPIQCSFLGSYCYLMAVPVSVYSISKLKFVGSYRTAKRYCDLMVEAGALAYTDNGMVVVTEEGKRTSDWFFGKLFEMPAQVTAAQPKAAKKALEVIALANPLS